MQIAKWISKLAESPTMALNAKVHELKSKGLEVISIIKKRDIDYTQELKAED